MPKHTLKILLAKATIILNYTKPFTHFSCKISCFLDINEA